MQEFYQLLQLTVLFVLVVGLAWLTARLVGTRFGASNRGSSLRVLQHIPAGRDRSIMLLEVGGRYYLLGITGHQVSLLDQIDDAGAIARILELTPPPSPLDRRVADTFSDLLGKALRRPALGGDPAEVADPVSEGPEMDQTKLREQIERLRRLQNK